MNFLRHFNKIWSPFSINHVNFVIRISIKVYPNVAVQKKKKRCITMLLEFILFPYFKICNYT